MGADIDVEREAAIDALYEAFLREPRDLIDFLDDLSAIYRTYPPEQEGSNIISLDELRIRRASKRIKERDV